MLAFKVTLAFVVLNISCLFTFIHSATPPAQVDFLSSLTTLPPRAGHRAFLVKNDTELVVFGGTSSTDPNQATIHITLPSSSNQSIEPRAFRYSDSASRRKSLYGFSAVAVNETHILCIFGSDPSFTDLGGLYVLWYDLLSEEWTDLATMGDTPLARFNQHDVVVDNGNVTTLFVYGGTSRVNGSTLADLVALSIPGSHSPNFFWTGYNFPPKAQNNPGKRSGHSMAAYGNYVFICFGLLDQNFVTNECSVLDTNSLKFVKATFKGEKPNPRIGATLSVQGSTIILFGGIDPTTSPPAEYNDLWTLNISNLDDLNWKKQSPTGSVPSPRYHHTSIIWNSDYMIVYGGKRNSGWAENVIHTLDIRKLEWSPGVLNPYAASSTSTDTSPSPNPNNIVDHPGYLLVLMFVCGGIGLTGALVLLLALLKRDRTIDPVK
ncbi:hypothetical protein BKA69DRAFT_1101698 [Paraphysoderma sedebokerense]|nr:hypothetical protein BKA69DRAFT_1101698 [Paraphysoderma sedebokerense]